MQHPRPASLSANAQDVAADSWGCDDIPVRETFAPLTEWLRRAAPSIDKRYPNMWKSEKHLARIVRNCLLSDELCSEYASYFAGKSEAELEELAKSFAFDNCVKRGRLNEILQEDGKREVV